MTTEILVQDEYERPFKLFIHHTELPSLEGEFALRMLERFGLVTMKPDGEDSADRQQFAFVPPEELVRRACDIAEESFKQLRERGWLVQTPSVQEALAQLKSRNEGAS